MFCDSSKFLKNISWPVNICLNYFMAPAKTANPATPAIYLMYGP